MGLVLGIGRKSWGPPGNERLTSSVGLVLLILLGVETLTTIALRSFLPEPGEDDDELAGDTTEPRLVFGHTHLAFRRRLARGENEIELINPGSVGLPLDGDPRAAYALMGADGEIDDARERGRRDTCERDEREDAAARRALNDTPDPIRESGADRRE